METNPQKGLDSVSDLLNHAEGEDGYIRMKLCLLRYWGEVRTSMQHTSDSTIKVLYDYFEKEGTTGDKMQANYCMGRTYIDMRNYPLAVLYLDKSVSIGEAARLSRTDSMMLANVYSQLSGVNSILNRQKSCISQAQKALSMRQNLGIDDAASYQDLANSYLRFGMAEEAGEQYKICAAKIASERLSAKNMDYIAQHLRFFSNSGDESMADWALNRLRSIDRDSLSSLALSTIANYFLSIEQNIDSSLYYYNLAYGKEDTSSSKASAARCLSLIYAYKGDYRKATDFASKYFVHDDSLQSVFNARETAAAQDAYHHQELEQMRNGMRDEQARRRRAVVYAVAIGMSTLTIVLFILYLNIKKRNKELETLARVRTEKEQIKEEYDQHLRIVEHDRILRVESGQDISSVIANLKAICEDSNASLSEDLWEDVFVAVDKAHPTFRDYVISLYPTIKNKDLIIVYLLQLKFSQADIARLFNVTRATINRKVKSINEKIGYPVLDMIGEYNQKERSERGCQNKEMT